MCFSKAITLTKEDIKKYSALHTLIAVKPIIVFKLVKKILGKSYFESAAMNFRYHAGYHYYFTQPLKPEIDGGRLTINEGFHSFDMSRLKRHDCYNRYHYSTIKCIIPKGSTYFQNDFGELVSDNLIFTGQIIRFKPIKPTKNGSKTNNKKRKKRA